MPTNTPPEVESAELPTEYEVWRNLSLHCIAVSDLPGLPPGTLRYDDGQACGILAEWAAAVRRAALREAAQELEQQAADWRSTMHATDNDDLRAARIGGLSTAEWCVKHLRTLAEKATP